VAAISQAVDTALDLLDNGRGSTTDAVAWLSGHLAALEHSVLAVAPRLLPSAKPDVAEQLRRHHQVQHLLRRLESVASGDATAHGSPSMLRAAIARDVRAIQGDTVALVRRIAEATDDDGAARLTAAYDDALAHGPSRPHLHGPRRGALERITWRLDSWRDRVLDTLDSRHNPLARQRSHR
jgi:hypothetical protein